MRESATPPELHRFEVTEASDDRLDAVLAGRLRLSRTRVVALLREGHVRVNGAPARKSYRVRRGDTVEVEIPPLRDHEIEPEELPVAILYRDDDLVVVDKPAGMVVHPAPGNRRGTLVAALLHHVGRLSSTGSPHRPGVVHRLDRDTSGLMIVARSDRAHQRLAADLARRRIRRGYLAAAWGHLGEERLRIELPIGRDPAHRKRMAIVESGRPALTHVRRLERWHGADLLAVRLETGRTHQIRVHLRAVGHPLVGDPIYAAGWERGLVGGGGRWAEDFVRRCGRLFLHAARLSFRHPITGETMTFTSPLPDPLRSATEWARATS